MACFPNNDCAKQHIDFFLHERLITNSTAVNSMHSAAYTDLYISLCVSIGIGKCKKEFIT